MYAITALSVPNLCTTGDNSDVLLGAVSFVNTVCMGQVCKLLFFIDFDWDIDKFKLIIYSIFLETWKYLYHQTTFCIV